jgi:hypothetical protein
VLPDKITIYRERRVGIGVLVCELQQSRGEGFCAAG